MHNTTIEIPDSVSDMVELDTSRKAHVMTNIIKHINLEDYETRYRPLEWQKRGLQQTASGYGSKLTSTREIKYEGRWRRIYVCCYSNAGTAYIVKGKDWIVIRE